MKKFLICILILFCLKGKSQTIQIPVGVTEPSWFIFNPTVLKLTQAGGGSFKDKSIKFYFEIRDSLQDLKNDYPRTMSITGEISFPSTLLNSCFDSAGYPIFNKINPVLNFYGLKLDTTKAIKL